jgi:hypothetical protein
MPRAHLRSQDPSEKTGLCTYPDVSVVCGPREVDPESADTVTNPTLLVEVTSKSTEEYDRGREVRSLPTGALAAGVRARVASLRTLRLLAVAIGMASIGCSSGKLSGYAGEQLSPECPGTQPSVGSSCSGVMTVCEYGDAWWDVSCDTVMGCNNGTWELSPAGQGPCVPAPGANPAACPMDPSLIQTGAACPRAQIDCYYGMGTECGCLGSSARPDAGPIWVCAPDTGCPSTRPKLGASCSAYGQMCGYGIGSTGIGEACLNGTWQPAGIGGG